MIQNVTYTLRRSLRARSLRIAIHGRDEVVVSAPRFVSEHFIQRFVASKSAWIKIKLEARKNMPDHVFLKSSVKYFEKYKAAAGGLASRRLAYFNQVYGLIYKKISIRNQKTRWGSCSKTGTISFNYKIVLLPSQLADYIIVHELCHLKEMNHSRTFWDLVAQTIPDYKRLRGELNGTRMRQ
jgi:predicted metal-dependent hydrolase